jgi:acetamidase/formamidase
LTIKSWWFTPSFPSSTALLIGDGHAAQGNGEVTITVLETSLIGTFSDSAERHEARWPRAETETHDTRWAHRLE